MGPQETDKNEQAAVEAAGQIAAGGPEKVPSFEIIVDVYGPGVLTLARRMLGDADAAEEAAQEVFLRVWRKIGLYNPAKGRFGAWLMRLATNLILNIAAKKQPSVDLKLSFLSL